MKNVTCNNGRAYHDNIVRVSGFVRAEFEIANEEYKKNRTKFQRLFDYELDYTSFVSGFTSGVKARENEFSLTEKENSEVQER